MSTPNQRQRKPSESELDQRRLESGECTRGCGREADVENGSSMCVECGPRQREAVRLAVSSLREQRRQARLCVDGCGRKAKKDRRRCASCIKARRDRKRRKRERGGVKREAHAALSPTFAERRAAIQARTTAELEQATSRSRGGVRKRYHGRGRRGAPSALDANEFDLRAIELELSRFRADMACYYSDENQRLPKIQREAARVSAAGHLELAGRYLGEIAARMGKGIR